MSGDSPFSDVEKEAETEWYYDAALWAEQNNMMKDDGDGMFHPEESMIWEEFAGILASYGEYAGYDFSAIDLVLDPQAIVTRAQAASTVHEFLEEGRPLPPVDIPEEGSGTENTGGGGTTEGAMESGSGESLIQESDVPKTGDSGNMGLWFVLMAFSLFTLLALLVNQRAGRRGRKETSSNSHSI